MRACGAILPDAVDEVLGGEDKVEVVLACRLREGLARLCRQVQGEFGSQGVVQSDSRYCRLTVIEEGGVDSDPAPLVELLPPPSSISVPSPFPP